MAIRILSRPYEFGENMYTPFFVMIGLACLLPIPYLVYLKKHKGKRSRSRSTKIWVCILSVILIVLFVLAVVLMSKDYDTSTVTLVGFAIILDTNWIMAFLARKKDNEP